MWTVTKQKITRPNCQTVQPLTTPTPRKNSDNTTEAKKADSDKNRLELIPPYAIIALGTILTDGAKKYGDHNWEKGMEWSRAYGAVQRHLNAWWGGQDTDTESGHSHLWHALCEIVFLVCYEKWYKNHDDRPKGKE